MVTGNPELIREIYSGDPSCYEAFGKHALHSILGPGSMLLLDGEPHRRERKLIMPMFHGARMKAYGDIIRQATLEDVPKNIDGEIVEALDFTTRISLKVIVQAVLGGEQA